MLNYIWAGLIVFSFVFAAVYDTRDVLNDTYRNGDPLPVLLIFPDGYDESVRRQNVTVILDGDEYGRHFGLASSASQAYSGTVIRSREGVELRFANNVPLPAPISTIRDFASSEDDGLRGRLSALSPSPDSTARAAVMLPAVRFVKMQAIVDAAFSLAEVAVNLALGLIGVIALWMGLLRIAEEAGIIHHLVRFTQPILRPLFPEIPKDHPAFGMIVLNLTANILGLGNAATPLGLKEMESLQELSPQKDTATNSMVMLLAMNTASVQIVPPVLLVAVMGLQINQLIFAIIITTSISLFVAIVAARLLSRVGSYATSDPMRSSPASQQN